jgi:Protein of unknown function (DUF1302)
MVTKRIGLYVATALASCAGVPANAYDFNAGDVHVSWDSQLTAGAGLRTESPSCSYVGGSGANTGCAGGGNSAQWGNGSLGNLNYKSGQFYSGYIKATSELLLSGYDGYKFMARGSFLYDEAALNTSETSLSNPAKARVAPNYQLLDLWGSKNYTINDMSGHVRVGNQVLNWGESYFASGGINATNSLDFQKLLIPGVQVKEAVLPAPMISIAQGLAPGLNVEAYYQLYWNHDTFPAVGTFWSTWNQLGAGFQPVNYPNANPNLNTYPGAPGSSQVFMGAVQKPPSQGEFGINLHYKPQTVTVDLGLYFENYHDKAPVFGYDANSGTDYFRYMENRQLYGISANFPLGDLAIGVESSYRPRDAVSLTGCFAGTTGNQLDANNSSYAGSCKQWKDLQKIQTDLVAQLNMQPSDYPILNRIAANFAVLTFENTVVQYPGVNNNGVVSSTQGGTRVIQGYDAGYSTWLSDNSNSSGKQILASRGTDTSAGLTLDNNWTYDGTLLPQWQVTPGVTFFYAYYGYTPNMMGQYEEGAKSLNFYVLLNQNPSVWQAGANFTHYWGGAPLAQPYGDRDNIGMFLTRNF